MGRRDNSHLNDLHIDARGPLAAGEAVPPIAEREITPPVAPNIGASFTPTFANVGGDSFGHNSLISRGIVPVPPPPRRGEEVTSNALINSRPEAIVVDSDAASSETQSVTGGSDVEPPTAKAKVERVADLEDALALMSHSVQAEYMAEKEMERYLKGFNFKEVFPAKVQQSEDVGALELFAGHCGLSKALTQAGFAALGVDWRCNRHKPVTACKWIDLETESGLKQVARLILARNVKYVHLCPPNGTSSAGRNNPRQQRRQLRTWEEPDGVAELFSESGGDFDPGAKAAVDRENKLYFHTAAMILWCSWRGILWTVESPLSSLMWETTPFAVLSKLKSWGELRYTRLTPNPRFG